MFFRLVFSPPFPTLFFEHLSLGHDRMIQITPSCWWRVIFHAAHSQLLLLTDEILSLLVALYSKVVSSSLCSAADLGLLYFHMWYAVIQKNWWIDAFINPVCAFFRWCNYFSSKAPDIICFNVFLNPFHSLYSLRCSLWEFVVWPFPLLIDLLQLLVLVTD